MPTVFCEKEASTVIDAGLKNQLPILLIGETGTGKTTIVANIANKRGYTLTRLSLNDQVGREDLIGKFGLKEGNTVWIDGPVLEAMRNGYWVVLDELNSARPEVLFALHALLDDAREIIVQEKDNEKVKAHKNFRVFATINPISYHGTKNLNQAFISRFVVVNINVLKPEEEAVLIKEKTGVDDKEIDIIVALGQRLREFNQQGNIQYFCSTRDLIMIAQLIQKGVARNHAINASVFTKMSSDDTDYIAVNHKSVGDMVKSFAGVSITQQIREFEAKKAEAKDYEEIITRLKAEGIVLEKKLALDESLYKESRSKLAADIAKITKEKDELIKYKEDLHKMTDAEKALLAKSYVKEYLSKMA